MSSNPHKVDLDLCLAALRKLAEGPTQYETIRKHVIRVTACGSSGKVHRAIRDIIRNGLARKVGPPGSRAPYKITNAGKLFLSSFERGRQFGDEDHRICGRKRRLA